MGEMFKDYIKKAETFYKEAVKELKEAKSKKNEVKARDACGKAWLAIDNASKALFVKSGIKEKELPKNYRGVNYLLGKFATRELRRIYDASYGKIHIAGYYNGDIDYNLLEERFEDVKEYISGIKNGIK